MTFLSPLGRFITSLWARYRRLAKWIQIVIGVVIVVVLVGLLHVLTASSTPAEQTSLPVVTVAPVDTLAGSGSSVTVIGSVRSVSEADLFAQSGGSVTAIHTTLGASVPAGFVIAELENASQQAAVLQAEGAYEAALAGQAGASPSDIAASARNTYTTAYSNLDTLLKTDIDTFFGATGGQGPQFLIGASPFDFTYFPEKRQALTSAMDDWRDSLDNVSSMDPQTLLTTADDVVHQAAALANDIAQVATKEHTDASPAQLTALAAARSGLATIQASVTAAKTAYQGQSTSATVGADASVKVALGGLRAAQAQLEKTLVRAPISGTVNFLPIHVGDYVATLTHVATVAQNGSLEIVANISEESRALLSVGTKVMVEDVYPATVTTIAPALDPVTKQIEVHFAMTGASPLVNGQSVRIALPSSGAASAAPAAGAATTTASSTTPTLLPLTALKLTPSARVVFSVGDDSRLVAHPVEIGDVHGDQIEIETPLAGDLEIVTDARGLSEGEKVSVATTTP